MTSDISQSGVLPWQTGAWQQFAQLKDRLPHALLLYGQQGIGKTLFAEEIARSLLCQNVRENGQACQACLSCGWFSQSNHPDFRCIRPEALEDGEEGEGDDGDAKKPAKAAKTPSKEIKIDQIRALADFMNVSTHRQGKRVVMLYPAEALNKPAANALLKTLEEPPPDTVFILVTHSIDRLLPTILSRCRKFAMPMPANEEALAWLKQQDVKDAATWLAEQGGAPLAALEQAQAGSREALDELLRELAQPSVDGALRTAEKLQKAPVPELVSWLQRWLYDLFSFKSAERIRYYPTYRRQLAALAATVDSNALMQALKRAGERRAVAEHPLSARLFIEDMLLDYSGLFTARSRHG